MAETSPFLIPSLIGGYTEQAAQSRPVSTTPRQINCVNDPLNDCQARAGGAVVGTPFAFSMSDPFIHEIQRGQGEFYKVFVENGQIKILNQVDGQLASIRGLEASGMARYLKNRGKARNAFAAVTVEDTTFIVNRQRVARMKTTRTAVRPNRGIFYFRSGSYSTTYKASIVLGTTRYTVSYKTPDNSDPANADYISTSVLAREMRDAFITAKSTWAPDLNTFSFYAAGSNLVVTRSVNTAFDLDSEDGQGDTQLIAFREWVDKFSDLPQRAPNGYIVGIRGSQSDQTDDYWVRYSGPEVTGYWEEVPSPNIRYQINQHTMPFVLKNTAKGVFVCAAGTWGDRISGDGVKTAKTPVFINKRIKSINFIRGRLCLITEGSFQTSRSRNAYSFFPDTAQASLDTDPIGFDIQSGEVTVVSNTVAISEHLFFWGDRNQLRLDSGDQALTEKSADCIPSTNYEYDGRVAPRSIGMGSIIFGSTTAGGNLLKEVAYKQGFANGEIPLNAHCPKLMRKPLRDIRVGSTAGLLFALTEEDDRGYIYQWLNQGNERVVTSWNTWTFRGITNVVSVSVRQGELYFQVKLGSYLVNERVPMDPSDAAVRDIRLDHRITQEGCSYSGPTSGGFRWATLDLPYNVLPADRDEYVVVDNEEAGASYRGRKLSFIWNSGTQISVKVPRANNKFFFGARVVAEREFNPLYINDNKMGMVLPDHILIRSIKVSHADTSEYKVRVYNKATGDMLHVHNFEGRKAIGDTINNALPKDVGEANFTVGLKSSDVAITLVNDSVYPSRWSMAKFYCAITER